MKFDYDYGLDNCIISMLNFLVLVAVLVVMLENVLVLKKFILNVKR